MTDSRVHERPQSDRPLVSPGVVRGGFWHKLPDGRLQCDLCPRDCKLREGQRGFCFVRQAEDGAINLTSYGRASGFCVDPIEKKPLNHFFPGTSVLSFGTAGCNLGCRFCQNWDISKAREAERLSDWAPPEAVAQAAQDAGCKSVAFTYNDPVIFAEYAMDVALACREIGIKTVAVTAGYMRERARRSFYSVLDGANVDLKAFSDRFYRKLCFADLGPVLETLRWLRHETDVWFEITTLLIPGHNDSDAEIQQAVGWLAENLGTDVPIHFSAFHPDFKMQEVPPTPASTLRRARQLAIEAGHQFVYTGNIHDIEGHSTSCPRCAHRVIERDWYVLGAYELDDDGHCRRCGYVLPGRFDGPAGTWGARRRRLSIHAD